MTEFNYQEIKKAHGKVRAEVELELKMMQDLIYGLWSLHDLVNADDTGQGVILSTLLIEQMARLDRLKEIITNISGGK